MKTLVCPFVRWSASDIGICLADTRKDMMTDNWLMGHSYGADH